MPGPSAPEGYAEEARAAAARADTRLDPAARRCLDAAQDRSRRMDDNHVGTEHIVLGVLAVDRAVAARLAELGITESSFLSQLHDEPGPSPDGVIPLTPRARMIVGLAAELSAAEGSMATARHLVLGVVAESRDWRDRGYDGPHHLEQAALAAGTDLAGIEAALGR